MGAKGRSNTILKADVVVVGGGFAGLSAALEARQRGASVVLLTRQGIFANNSSIGGGLFLCVDTPMQKELGIKDSPEILASDILNANRHRVDTELLNAATREATHLYEWLTGFGARFVKVMQYSGHSVPRLHRDVTLYSRSVVKGMFEAAQAQGIDIRRGTPANELMADRLGRIIGVKARGNGWELEAKASKGVVLCAGGFGRNREMMRTYMHDLADLPQLSAAGSTGEGIKIAMAAGAQVTNMDAAVTTFVSPIKRSSITEEMFVEGAILVNKDGRRFVNETIGRQLATFPLMQQQDHIGFIVFDEQTKQKVTKMKSFAEMGILTGPYTAAELAERLGINEYAFDKTIAEYNQALRPAMDAFGHEFVRRQLQGKLYAISVTVGVVMTHGGVRINARAQVMHKEGYPIPGLYAAGDNVTGPGGPAGEQAPCPGYISGLGYFWAFSTGRIAGRNAAL